MSSDARRPDALANFFAHEGPLAREKAHYMKRPEQVELARAVEYTFAENGVLLCDAPTGIGKSIGYISPAILRAAEVGEKVVISTATISLQSQKVSTPSKPTFWWMPLYPVSQYYRQGKQMEGESRWES